MNKKVLISILSLLSLYIICLGTYYYINKNTNKPTPSPVKKN